MLDAGLSPSLTSGTSEVFIGKSTAPAEVKKNLMNIPSKNPMGTSEYQTHHHTKQS